MRGGTKLRMCLLRPEHQRLWDDGPRTLGADERPTLPSGVVALAPLAVTIDGVCRWRRVRGPVDVQPTSCRLRPQLRPARGTRVADCCVRRNPVLKALGRNRRGNESIHLVCSRHPDTGSCCLDTWFSPTHHSDGSGASTAQDPRRPGQASNEEGSEDAALAAATTSRPGCRRRTHRVTRHQRTSTRAQHCMARRRRSISIRGQRTRSRKRLLSDLPRSRPSAGLTR